MQSFTPFKGTVTHLTDDENLKKEKELLLIKAENYTDAETRAYQHIEDLMNPSLVQNVDITKTKYDITFLYEHIEDVNLKDLDDGLKWYEGRIRKESTTEKGKLIVEYDRFLILSRNIKVALDVLEETNQKLPFIGDVDTIVQTNVKVILS